MKNKNTIIFVVTLLLSLGAFAQISERSRLIYPNATQSIVRMGSGIYYYVYTQNSTSPHSFSQVERSSNLTLKIVNLASNYTVTDFVLYNGRIYFTGDYNSSTGYVGWFDVDSVFNGNGTIHYYQFKYTSTFPVFSTYYYKDFRKIKVFNVGTAIHAVVLGTRYYTMGTGSNCCLMDYAIGATTFTYAYNTGFPEYFEDIAVTGSALVTAARKGMNEAGLVYMRNFPLASFSLTNPVGNTVYYFPNLHTISGHDIYLQSTSSSSDTFFAVYYSEEYNTGGLVCQGLRINPCCVIGTIIQSCGNSLIVNNQGTTLSSACKIRGTTYNTRWRRLMVLQDMDSPISPNTTVSAVSRFLHSGTVVSYERSIYWSGIPYSSLSMYNVHRWIACGLLSGTAHVLIEDCTNIGTLSCVTHNTSITTSYDSPLNDSETYNLTTGTASVTHYTSSPTVSPSLYIHDCSH